MLDRRELVRLLDATERDDVWEHKHDGKRERDRLLLALIAYAGLRRSELLGLDWADVDLEGRLLKVRNAKGGRQRVLPIHPALEPLFLNYLRVRVHDGEPAPFVGVHGRRLSQTVMTQKSRAGASHYERCSVVAAGRAESREAASFRRIAAAEVATEAS